MSVPMFINAGLTLTCLPQGLEITCNESELFVFDPPTGQTCDQWAGPFVNATAGYLANPTAISECAYCPIRVGDEVRVHNLISCSAESTYQVLYPSPD